VICACVFGCFLQVLPERSMACSGNMTNMVVGGFDPRPDYERDFVMYIWKEGGYGGRPGKKDNHTAISLYASGTRNEPVEVQERVYPILTHRYEFITDSAGAGRHRGGMGVTRDFELTDGDATLSVLGSRGVQPVWGWEGGHEALGSGLIHDWGGEDELEIGVMRSGIHAKKGKVIRFWEGGGGGWQDPRTRPPEWVLEDVIDGFVSVEAARDVYGVAVRLVDEDAGAYEIDEAETGRLRGQTA
jgi:N-methylhydantoinase B